MRGTKDRTKGGIKGQRKVETKDERKEQMKDERKNENGQKTEKIEITVGNKWDK